MARPTKMLLRAFLLRFLVLIQVVYACSVLKQKVLQA